MAKTAVAEPTETAQPLQRIKKRGRGRPPAGSEPPIPVSRQFFDKIAAIGRDDWGTRAWLYLYRLEPYTDRMRSGNQVNIMKYAEPIDEARVMMDFGSGRYRAILTFKKPGAEKSDELDRTEFEIMNLNFPPRVPKGEWLDDPRNMKWSWARDHQGTPAAPLPATGAEAALEQFRVYNEIQDSMAERMKPAIPAGPVVDPMVTAMSFAEKILAAKADNPMVDVLRDELKNMREEIRAEREANRVLQAEMRQQSNAPKASGLDTFKAIVAEAKTLIPDLKELFPVSESRARGPWWVGIAEQAIQAAAPVVPQLIQQFSAPRPQQNGFQPQQHQNGAPAQPQLAAPATAPLDLDAMLLSTLSNGGDGDEFASGLNTFFGQQGKIAYQSACALGADGLLTFLKGRAVWNELGDGLQAKMPAFIQEFIGWGKPDDADVVDAVTEVIT